MSRTHYSGNWESVNKHTVPKWYDDCKFGIFIHWGIYSVPAYAPHTWELGTVSSEEWFENNPYAEWYYNSINIGRGATYEHHVKTYGKDFKYEDFIPMWKAENWDPGQWADIFREAGAKYVVLTTKHHDGFCLFPSKYTHFNSVEMGPKRNITKELTDAVRNAGLKMGLYYSGLIDWQFANDPILCDDDLFENASPTYAYADFSYNQMMELVDTYKPSVFWNDIGWPKQSEQSLPRFLAHYYNTVEEGVVDDRFNDLYHDFLTKEYQSGESTRKEKWEMCRGMGLSFGYNANEDDSMLITDEELVRLLVKTVADNGNLLLNIGPKPDGTIPEEQVRRLKILGAWLKINQDGIYGSRCCDRGPEQVENGIELYFTQKEDHTCFYADNLKDGENSFLLRGVHNSSVRPMDPRVDMTMLDTDEGTRLTIKNYHEDQYLLGFSYH